MQEVAVPLQQTFKCTQFWTTLHQARWNHPNPGQDHSKCPSFSFKSRTGGILIGAQEDTPIINALIELGHPQPTLGTPIKTDNSSAHDNLKAPVHIKHSNAF